MQKTKNSETKILRHTHTKFWDKNSFSKHKIPVTYNKTKNSFFKPKIPVIRQKFFSKHKILGPKFSDQNSETHTHTHTHTNSETKILFPFSKHKIPVTIRQKFFFQTQNSGYNKTKILFPNTKFRLQ